MRERIAIYLTNLGRYNEGYLMGEWVKLPIPKDKLDDVLCRIGIDEEHRGRFYEEHRGRFYEEHREEHRGRSTGDGSMC